MNLTAQQNEDRLPLWDPAGLLVKKHRGSLQIVQGSCRLHLTGINAGWTILYSIIAACLGGILVILRAFVGLGVHFSFSVMSKSEKYANTAIFCTLHGSW